MTLNGRYALYCTKDAYCGANHRIWMKIDPYYQRQKCRPMTLLSGDIRFMLIFAVVPWGEGVKRQCGCRQRQFWAFSLAISSDTLEMRPVLLYSDTQSDVGFSVILKCLILNDLDWLFRVKFCFCAGLSGFRPCELSKIIAWKLVKIDTYRRRRKSSTGTLVSGSTKFMRIFARVLWRRDVKGQWDRALTHV